MLLVVATLGEAVDRDDRGTKRLDRRLGGPGGRLGRHRGDDEASGG